MNKLIPAVCCGFISIGAWAAMPPPRHSEPASSERVPFVRELGVQEAPLGLDGANIAVWQSHGLYYKGKDEWGWQRPRLYQTCEDLFTQSFVMPFLMPMLQNAGAYVMSPRERDISVAEYIIDNDDRGALYSEKKGNKKWETSRSPGFAFSGGVLTDGVNPFRLGSARSVQCVDDPKKVSSASWNADIDAPGDYAVYVSYQSLPRSASDAVYVVNAADGEHRFRVNQRMGGGTWVYLGHFPFEKGRSDVPLVQLSNLSSEKKAVISADAVKIGGGMGNVARRPSKPSADGVEYDYCTSGYPRFTEGARYWLQWAGAPDSVFSPSGYENDYTDDYRSRGLWVNWLMGGSSVLPSQKGLGIPIDLAFAFHSDAGITKNDSIIGTLGIYFTDNKVSYANGIPRLAARELVNSVMTSIVNDIRSEYEPNWTRRDMWNRNYAEARVPETPTMLLELLSHQNFADMRYGLDPSFRFAVSRAIYKGMLRFIAKRDGRQFVVQPLPVRAFAISKSDAGKDAFKLSWKETADKLEPSAAPTYYIVEERVADAVGFSPVAVVDVPEYVAVVSDSQIHSYRIVAGNAGGRSFPSEVLALCNVPDRPQVTVVNGFTRVSAPESFDNGLMAGFCDFADPGVPYIRDISYVGSQFEFRRDIPWMANETAGLGASRSNFEDKTVAGNTFDFVALHGESIVKAGYGFVSSSVEAFAVASDRPAIVDLILGTQKELAVGSGKLGTKFKSFDGALQRRLSGLASSGTNIFVSGAYIATDLWCNPFSDADTASADQSFAKDVLGYTWRSDKASETGAVVGVKNRFGMFDNMDFRFSDSINADCYAVASPGAIAPASAECGAVVLKYASGGLPAATAYDGASHRSVAMGFPFETVLSPAVRDSLMLSILNFLSNI